MKKKLLLIITICLLLLGVTSCSKNEFNVGKKSPIEIIKQTDVTFKVKQDTLTPTGATFILENHSNEEYGYGAPFHMEIKKNNTWHEIEVELYFIMPMYSLPANEKKEIDINWKDSYGTLAPGTYRIVKSVSKETLDGKIVDYNVAAVFEIN